ncbi:hypothetical protein VE02_06487 [Pseudogymnoascus sp. 03VT05]|nr:hypothetical protein VE02_06487 [Pseudogymnoascus sp. 03VT05]
MVCPKSVCSQWEQTIQNSYKEGYAPKVVVLGSKSKGKQLTAHDLLRERPDVVITTYEQIDSSHRHMRDLSSLIDDYVKDAEGITKRILGVLIKRLILDKAQVANKRSGTRHRALQALYFEATIVLSRTLAHNIWYDVARYFDFIKGHPVTSDAEFMRLFSSNDYDDAPAPLSITQMGILQKFMMAFTIARPPSTIHLSPCTRSQALFDIPPKHKA